MIRHLFDLAKSFAAIAILATASQAAVSWTSPSGSSTTIDYAGGQTSNGLFTDSSPFVMDDKFLFFPAGFSANSDTTGHVEDVLSFIVTSKPGKSLKSISTGLSGDWSLLGSGAVDITGVLKITNLSTSSVLTQNLTFSPSMPTADQGGLFNGTGLINLPNGWTNAKVELSTNMDVYPLLGIDSPTGFTGFAQLKTGDIQITSAAVPLPAALAAAPLGFAVAWVARRRMSK